VGPSSSAARIKRLVPPCLWDWSPSPRVVDRDCVEIRRSRAVRRATAATPGSNRLGTSRLTVSPGLPRAVARVGSPAARGTKRNPEQNVLPPVRRRAAVVCVRDRRAHSLGGGLCRGSSPPSEVEDTLRLAKSACTLMPRDRAMPLATTPTVGRSRCRRHDLVDEASSDARHASKVLA